MRAVGDFDDLQQIMELGQIYIILAIQVAKLALVAIAILFYFAFEAEQKKTWQPRHTKKPLCFE